MKTRTIVYSYFLVGGLNLIAIYFSNADLIHYTKPLLMPLLIYLVFLSKAKKTDRAFFLVMGALIFSWIGDVVLMYDKEWYFLGGLGAFFIAQLCYTFALNESTFGPLRIRFVPLLPIITYGIILSYLLIPEVEEMKLPVIAYALVILAMVSSARLRQGRTSNASFSMCFYGATLFVISDSLLAFNRFAEQIPMGSFWVMLTYILAQYLLIKGIISHPSDHLADS